MYCFRTLEVAVNGRKQGATKKHYATEKACLKICKQEFCKMFISKLKEFNIVLDIGCKIQELSYGEIKKINKSYQENWKILQRKFGIWTSKDPALLDFHVA